MNSSYYFYIFFGVYILRNLLEIVFQPKAVKDDSKRTAADSISFFFIVSAHIAAGIWICYVLYQGADLHPVLFVCGCCTFLIGFIGRVFSLKHLGRNFSKTLDAVQEGYLVTTGIYSRIRHPLYFFYILEMTGFILVYFDPVSAAALVIVTGLSVYRITAEENQLSLKYGRQFDDYKAGTKKLIPFVF